MIDLISDDSDARMRTSSEGAEDEDEDAEEGSSSGSSESGGEGPDFSCVACGDAGEGEELLLCDGCDSGCGV